MTTEATGQQTTTRERIPVVALRLFADKGYDATSMREIAEQLDISKAALYYHFDSKEDIVRALVDTMLDQVGELVDWAKTQTRDAALRTEVLTRWSNIMQAQGLAMFRFVTANRKVLYDVRPDHSGMAGQLAELYAILVPSSATVEEQLRVRLALMSINMAGLAGTDIDATDAEILAAARTIAAELLPRGE